MSLISSADGDVSNQKRTKKANKHCLKFLLLFSKESKDKWKFKACWRPLQVGGITYNQN